MSAGDGGQREPESGDVGDALAGEETAVHGTAAAGPRSAQRTRTRTGGGGEQRMVAKERPRSYHDHPVVKPPAWTAEVPWYFFAGGLAGASSLQALAAEAGGNSALARRSWALALAGVSVSPVLLISDLGRPERFLNMLRVFKVTSPMSVGSWLLAANGAVVAPAAAGALLGRRNRLTRTCEKLAALLGPPLSTYTAVLIANTAVPVWSEARTTLPFVFAASSAASAGAAAGALTPDGHAGPARRLAILGGTLELAASATMEHRLGALGDVYEREAAGRLGRAAKLLTAAGGAVLAVGGRRRSGRILGGSLMLAGAGCLRWSVFKAGFQSAADPEQTVGPQRARLAGQGG